jgi:hypothetical protein
MDASPAECAPVTTPTIVIVGRALADDGSPVTSARIQLCQDDQVLAETVTDGAGAYLVRVETAVTRLVVRGSRGGTPALEGEVAIEPRAGFVDADVVLRTVREVVVVVRKDGVPSSGIPVALADETEPPLSVHQEEKTDDDGAARFRTDAEAFAVAILDELHLPDPREVVLSGADHRVWTPATLWVAAPTTIVPRERSVILVELEARTGAVVSGRVLAPDGRPVAHADVFGPYFWIEGRTDEDGRFTLDRVPPGPFTLHVSARDDAELADADIAVAAPGDVGDVVLAPGARLELELAPAELVEKVEVEAWHEGRFERVERAGWTNKEGSLVVSGLAPGIYRARIRAGELTGETAPLRAEPGRPGRATIELRAAR